MTAVRLLTLGAASALLAGATTWDISYSGSRTYHDITVTGSGVFTYVGALQDVQLSDLTSFNYSENVLDCDRGCPAAPSVFNFSLSDLQKFDLQVNGNGGETAWLIDAYSQTNGGWLYTGLPFGQQNQDGTFELLTAGSTGFAFGEAVLTDPVGGAVPEPAPLALLGAGLFLLGLAARRRATHQEGTLQAAGVPHGTTPAAL